MLTIDLIKIVFLFSLILAACNPTNTPRPLTVEEKEQIRKAEVEQECAIHPERCEEDFDSSRYDPSCEPPIGEELDWNPPAHCFKNVNGRKSESQNGKKALSTSEECPNGCTEHKPGCDIKGNISVKTGEKIYHLPGDEYYEETQINSEYGELWFCTGAEARANGWRRARK